LSFAHRSFLAQQIKEQPDATLVELQERLQERKKVSVSPSTLSRELQLLRLPRKKSRWSPVNVTTENARGSGGG
jgi:transposase